MSDHFCPLVRTDFSDEAKWEKFVSDALSENEMGFRAYVEPISDLRFDRASADEVAETFRGVAVAFVADSRALQQGEILCLDPADPGHSFRVVAGELWVVENNVSTGNLLFEELLGEVDDDGVLRAPTP